MVVEIDKALGVVGDVIPPEASLNPKVKMSDVSRYPVELERWLRKVKILMLTISTKEKTSIGWLNRVLMQLRVSLNLRKRVNTQGHTRLRDS